MLSPLRRTILWRYENAPYSHRYSAGRHAQPAGASHQCESQAGTPLCGTDAGLPAAWYFRGTAWLEKNEIRLNPVLLLENQREFIDEVVPHELAHLLVWQHFGRVAPHGKEWKWMMESVLGVPARRTHRFELASVRQNTFPYRCRCQQHQLTVRRHNRVVRGEATYRCVRCGDLLVAEK
ncbi:protein sprT [Klebsiella pneumoniae subsp. pneumoniae]|nr:protein sprT [Klebsiella pneumoniae subsp. pneumoniae]